MTALVHFRTHVLASILLTAWFAACSASIAPFSQTAYRLATDLKVESLKLMEKAEMPFEEQAKEVDKLGLELEKAYEFAKVADPARSGSKSARRFSQAMESGRVAFGSIHRGSQASDIRRLRYDHRSGKRKD